MNLLKKISFIIFYLISSVLCKAIELDPWEAPLKHYQAKEFDAGYDALVPLIQKDGVKTTSVLSQIFVTAPEAVNHFATRLEGWMTKDEINFADGEMEKTWEIEPIFLKAFYDNKDIIRPTLNAATLEAMGERLLNASLLKTTDLNQRENYRKEAIRHYVNSFFLGSDSSFEKLSAIINGKYGKLEDYENYYNFLIPFLGNKFANAQSLFNNILFDSERALDWTEKYIEFLNKNYKVHKRLIVLEESMECFRKEEKIINYDKAIKLLERNPRKAIDLLMGLEHGNMDAKHKLNELRQSKGYKGETKFNENDPGCLLKEWDRNHSIQSYETYIKIIEENRKKKGGKFTPLNASLAVSCLYEAALLKNQGAVSVVNKIKKSKGYKDAATNAGIRSEDFDYCLGYQYYCACLQFSDEDGQSIKKITGQEKRLSSAKITSKDINPFIQNKGNAPSTSSQDIRPSMAIELTESQTIIPPMMELPQPIKEKVVISNNRNPHAQQKNDSQEDVIKPLLIPDNELTSFQEKHSVVVGTPLKTHRSSHKAKATGVSSEPSLRPTTSNSEEKKEISKTFNNSSLEQPKIASQEDEVLIPSSSQVKHAQELIPFSREKNSAGIEKPVNNHRPLQRAQSLNHLPKAADASSEPSLKPVRNPIKRTLSLNKISTTIPDPVVETEKKEKRKGIGKTMSLKQFIREKKKPKQPNAEEKSSQSSIVTPQSKTSSSQSQSEEKLSKSEESLPKGEKKEPFPKLTRKLSDRDLKRKSGVKLTMADITQTLNDLQQEGSIDPWSLEDNKINATKKGDKETHLTLHTHNEKSDRPWFEKPDNIEHFLWLVGKCHEGLNEQISGIGKKSVKKL